MSSAIGAIADPTIGALPPAVGISDPNVQAWIDQMTAIWNERNGLSGPGNKQFLTRAQAMETSFAAIAATFSNGSGITPPSGSPLAAEVDATIAVLQDQIRKSLIFQTLEQNIGVINTDAINAQITAALGSSRAAIANETQTRADKDSALASAVNTIWASIGGSAAVIQDGQLADVSPSAVSATKWVQVQAAVTDPNTGLVNSTSIKQDLNSYASAANGTFNSVYSVRAQLSVGGQTIVGGFGLAATSGAGSAQGGSIDFGVRADRFFIAATSATPDGTTQENQGNSIPFMVLTYSQYVNGKLYPPGVFIKNATIGDATIGTAKIGDAAITNAKIGGDIYSDNWGPSGGSAGWYMQRSGTLYALNGYFRGDITATSLTANTVYADQIVSGSLNQFFAKANGNSFSFSVPVGAKAVILTAFPGDTSTDGKTGGTYTAHTADLVIDGVYKSSVKLAGSCYAYDIPAGNHTITVFANNSSTIYPGVINVDIIAR